MTRLWIVRAGKQGERELTAIEQSKQRPFSALLFGLGIRHVGFEVAALLARHFGNIDAIEQASAEEIAEIEGITSKGPSRETLVRAAEILRDRHRAAREAEAQS